MLSGVHFNPTSYPSYIIMVYRACLFVHEKQENVFYLSTSNVPSNVCAMRFPLASSQVRNASTVFFPSRLSDLQWFRPSQSSSRKTSYHQSFHYHSVGSFCHTVLFIGGFPIDCTVIQILNIGCKTRVGEQSLMSYKRYFMVLCIAFVLFAAAS